MARFELASGATFQGQIKDKETNGPLQFVNIVVLGTNTGTSSNEHGEFLLKNISLPSKLVFTHIGYNSDTLEVADSLDYKLIYLTPSIISLPEVGITPGGYAQTLLTLALNKLVENAGFRYPSKAFYRQVSFNDEVATEIQEIIYHTETNNFRVWKADLFQGRYAAKKESKYDFKNFSLYTVSGFSIVQYDPQKGYSYPAIPPTIKIVKFLEKDGVEKIAEVSVYSDANKEHETLFFIDVENFNLLRIVATRTDDLSINLPPGHKLVSQKIIWDYTFKALNDSTMCLDYIDVNLIFDASYLFKTTKVKIQSHTYFYDYFSERLKDESTIKYNKSDRKTIQEASYDPQIWKDNPIFKRTKEQEELIATFDKTNSFGTIK